MNDKGKAALDGGCPPPIIVPYLLVSGIPFFTDSAGRRWVGALWHKDLVEHVRYLKKLTLAAPVLRAPAPTDAICLDDDPRFAGVSYVDLPASQTEMAGILNWPRTFAILWRAVGRARIVHAGVADWPIPTGWAASLAARLQGRALLINVESAFWRVPKTASLARRGRSWAWERLNRWCVRRASLPLFTQHEYARQMLNKGKRGHVFNASWIDAEKVLSEDAARECWKAKRARERLSLLFAGRLVAEKGVLDLLDAMKIINADFHLDIIGEGELSESIKEAALQDSRIRLLSPLAYDSAFFELIRGYDAVLVPSRTDEQARIIYDAYSQGVSVLATATAGNLDCVSHGESGYVAQAAGAPGICELIKLALSDREALQRMGLKSLRLARTYTHQEMHRRRWQLLDQFIADHGAEI